ncbi:hypothetical protein Gohar_021368 [Gossypium harknessii]|uniref:Uncharacterized protein n=1 Tax=Gossypium harknessii TaxID=34285 RepID=A0A7J9I7X2_9ROSI|nr:hypothetical protein [Gossypium harknessii]
MLKGWKIMIVKLMLMNMLVIL